MRRKVFIIASIVIALLALMIFAWPYLTPSWPPLRPGMSKEEVECALQKSPGLEMRRIYLIQDKYHEDGFIVIGYQNTYFVPQGMIVRVNFDLEMRVMDWEVEESPTDRPSWFDRAMNAVGL
jgi:hypothetical protein